MRARKTVPLTGTTRRTQVLLSADADKHLESASLWLQDAGGVTVTDSAIIRRALALYSVHLETADARGEFASTCRASKVFPS